MPWSDWVNAELYDRYTREQPLYRALNTRLVELAEVARARRVLDLACGTGATTRACLAVLPADGEVVGVDASLPMVEVARARVSDPRASFRVSSAAQVARLLRAPFDRVVCNAAFGQFPAPGAVLAAVAAVLAPGGLFAFDLPAAELAGERVEVHPFQVALSRAVGRRAAATPAQVDPERLTASLDEAGLELVARERFVYRGNQRELMDLMEIPAMMARAAPGLSAGGRADALARARRTADPTQAVEVPWLYLVARRR